MSTSARRRLMRDFKVPSFYSMIISNIPTENAVRPTCRRQCISRQWKRHDMVLPPLQLLSFPFREQLTMVRNAVIIGPTDTPFEDGTFKLVMQFDENYPNKPPQVKFISRMVCPHPNPADVSFIRMCMHREISVLIFSRIGGRRLMMSLLFSPGNLSFYVD